MVFGQFSGEFFGVSLLYLGGSLSGLLSRFFWRFFNFLGGFWAGIWASFGGAFGRVFEWFLGSLWTGFLVFLCIFWAVFGKRRCTDRSLYSIKIAFKSITEPSALY